MNQPFADRHEAGAELATKLGHFANRDDVVVLALPRGGVPVAFEVAEALDVPLDIFLVRKLGMPGYPELAMGAIASGGVRVLNEDVVRWYGISDRAIEAAALDEQRELERREREYRHGRSKVDLKKKIAILIDDGLATGSTMRAACPGGPAALPRPRYRRGTSWRNIDMRGIRRRDRRNHLRTHTRAVLGRRTVVSRLFADDR